MHTCIYTYIKITYCKKESVFIWERKKSEENSYAEGFEYAFSLFEDSYQCLKCKIKEHEKRQIKELSSIMNKCTAT